VIEATCRLKCALRSPAYQAICAPFSEVIGRRSALVVLCGLRSPETRLNQARLVR
jgi:hypothetical protein